MDHIIEEIKKQEISGDSEYAEGYNDGLLVAQRIIDIYLNKSQKEKEECYNK